MFIKPLTGVFVIKSPVLPAARRPQNEVLVCTAYGINAFMTGGKLSDENRLCLVGSGAEKSAEAFHADFCFFSVQSLTKDGLLYDCFESEVPVRRTMMKNSEKRVFLCDVGDVDYVIGDTDISEYLINEYKNVTFINVEK